VSDESAILLGDILRWGGWGRPASEAGFLSRGKQRKQCREAAQAVQRTACGQVSSAHTHVHQTSMPSQPLEGLLPPLMSRRAAHEATSLMWPVLTPPHPPRFAHPAPPQRSAPPPTPCPAAQHSSAAKMVAWGLGRAWLSLAAGLWGCWPSWPRNTWGRARCGKGCTAHSRTCTAARCGKCCTAHSRTCTAARCGKGYTAHSCKAHSHTCLQEEVDACLSSSSDGGSSSSSSSSGGGGSSMGGWAGGGLLRRPPTADEQPATAPHCITRVCVCVEHTHTQTAAPPSWSNRCGPWMGWLTGWSWLSL